MPEVIIIGGGVIGCSIGYHLAKMGCHDVAILEKGLIGSGSTERCAGGIRQQFFTQANIKFSMESVRFFERFEEETGHPADFRQNGYLMLITAEEDLAMFRQSIALQRSLGVDVNLLSPQEARGMVPGINIEDVLGASYCPTDGYADPYSVVQGFSSAARSLGVRIYQEAEVTGIERSGRAWCVNTTRGKFEAPGLIVAAGAWSSQIGEMVDVDIPVRPVRRHLFVTAPVQEIARNAPMVIEFCNGLWFRREGLGLIFGMRNPEEPEGFNTAVDWSFIPTISEVVCHRLPFLSGVGLARAQAGLYEDTPDVNAIIGGVPGVDGLYLACGFSGHGFMHAPAVGRVVAELVLGKSPSSELAPFALERFKLQAYQKEQCFV